MMTIDHLYPLLPKQEEISILEKKYRLYGGARGGGKSYWLRSEIVTQCNGPNPVRGLVLRRTFPEVYENTIVPLLSELPREMYDYNQTKGIMNFKNGSTVKFAFCRNYQDVLKYQGVEYDFIAIEELTHWTEDEFKVLTGSLRTTKEGITPNFFATTNPGSIGHKWVKRLWIDKDYQNNEYAEEYGFVQAIIYDNPILMEMDPAYVRNLEGLPEIQRKAFLEGDWDVFAGQYFDEWRKEIHTCKPYMPQGRKIIALDYGYSAPSAVYWINKSNTGKITTYRELYVTKHTYKQLAAKIAALTGYDEFIECVVVDPAVLNKKSDATGTSFLDEAGPLLDWKIIGANNERINGWNVVRQGLQHRYDPNDNDRVTAILEVSEACPNLIRTLPQQIYDKINVEDLNTHLEDHAVDGLRYGLMYLGVDKLNFSDIKQVTSSLEKSKQQKGIKRFGKSRNNDILEETF